jgi:hypothetical protein
MVGFSTIREVKDDCLLGKMASWTQSAQCLWYRELLPACNCWDSRCIVS